MDATEVEVAADIGCISNPIGEVYLDLKDEREWARRCFKAKGIQWRGREPCFLRNERGFARDGQGMNQRNRSVFVKNSVLKLEPASLQTLLR